MGRGNSTKKRVRMADIANQLGISVVSVSKGLSGKDGVSAEMRARILQTADELGYVPDGAASGQGKACTKNIGVLVADRFFDENTFYANIYRDLVKRCARNGCSVLLEIVTDEAEQRRETPVFLIEKKVDALIFLGEVDVGYLEATAKCGLPYLLMDFYNEAVSAESVLSDNLRGGYCVTEYLLQQGRRRLAFVGSVRATSSNMDRCLGYVKALLCAGLTPRGDWILEDRSPNGRQPMLELPDDLPDGFVCCNDETAFHVVEALKERGLRIPEDIAVTGYDDFRFATLCQPQLTTYQVHTEEMASAAVSLIMEKLRGTHGLPPQTIIRGELIIRASA